MLLFWFLEILPLVEKKSEYELVKKEFSSLAKNHKVILSPGNHDHDFSSYSGAARETLISSGIGFDNSIFDIATAGQKDYFEFENNICNVNCNEKTLLSNKYMISDSVSIQTFNTAWCSTLHEKGGSLNYPIEQIIDSDDNSKLKILFFHHPLSWLSPDNNKEVRNKIRTISNVIISGHEHIEDSFKVDSDDGVSLIIETCSFYDPSVEDNGFLTFSSEAEDIIISKHVWDEKGFKTTATKNKNSIIELNSKYISGFRVKDNFYDKLMDILTGFSHPEKDDLKLNDLFIYQNINNTSSGSNTIQSESSKNLFLNYPNANIILSGEESIGKTTLLKKLCLDVLERNGFSVFIDGSEIKRSDRYNVKKLEAKIKSQYENFNFDDFLKKTSERILFIDNFHLVIGNEKNLNSLLELFNKFFTRIIITVSDSYDLSQNRIKGESIFRGNFISLEILKMGHALRWELIRKWNNLKSECCVSDQILLRKTSKACEEVARVIGKNYIPSTPFFLLTMLQSMDSSIPSDLNTSSYGHYYHYLITCSLGLSGVDKDKLDGIFNYITELSFYYYKNNNIECSRDNLWDFNAKINHEYTLKVDCDKRLDLLVRSKILKETNGYYSFRYPYVYYYFLSKYLSDHFSEDEIQKIISILISNLDKRKNMNTLMFLTHHSKERKILDNIVKRSKTLFSDYEVADFNEGTLFLDKMIENLNLREMFFQDGDVNSNRLEIEKAKDRHEELLGEEEDDDDDCIDVPNAETSLNELLRDFNLTFKSVDLLGQLTRNYHESLKTEPKLMLLSEAIEAPLRALESIFSIMRNDSDTLLDMIQSRLKEEVGLKEYSKDELEIIARKFLFTMLKTVSFAIIKKISSAIGSRELLPVIQLINENDKKSNAIRLIELSVQLDLGSLGAIEEISKMVKDFKLNTLSGSLLRELVGHYLYMFDENISNKTKVCSLLRINYIALDAHQHSLLGARK
ncbi:NACHT domain-containing protein [Vibrio metschnikovii]|uniref:NACHT domain-containing protein n=1 Tax=Vibrio metschnikovii TaxID=28172 RepID=UPI0020C60D62|nr:AAA family ATPase [Vibrio metschnikovii]